MLPVCVLRLGFRHSLTNSKARLIGLEGPREIALLNEDVALPLGCSGKPILPGRIGGIRFRQPVHDVEIGPIGLERFAETPLRLQGIAYVVVGDRQLKLIIGAVGPFLEQRLENVPRFLGRLDSTLAIAERF